MKKLAYILATSIAFVTINASDNLKSSEKSIAEQRCYFDFQSQIKDKDDDKMVTNYCDCYMEKTKSHWETNFIDRVGNVEFLMKSRDICASKHLNELMFKHHHEVYYYKFFDADVDYKTERRYDQTFSFMVTTEKWEDFVKCHQKAFQVQCKRLVGLQAIYNCHKDAWATMNHDRLYKLCLEKPIERKPAYIDSRT